MSSSVAINGDLTPAQRLQVLHSSDTAHKATVEDVMDEEDLAHPPPSLLAQQNTQSADPSHAAEESVSANKVGKRKEGPLQEQSSQAQSKAPVLDMQSEESFPALGGPPSSKSGIPSAMRWGSNTGPMLSKPISNGTNAKGPLSSSAPSPTSTPTSGVMTPMSATMKAAQRPQQDPTLQSMALPGRHSQRITFAPSQLLPRSQLKKPVQEILRAINKRSKAKVEMKQGPQGVIIFEGTGPYEDTRQALRDVAHEVGSKQSVTIPVPVNVRPHIIGRSGAVIQGIAKRTGARIQMPSLGKGVELDPVEDDMVDVVIEGDALAAEMARQEIEAIVNERTSSVDMRIRNIPSEFYPFIAGPHNSRVNEYEHGRDVTVNIPHYHTWTDRPPPPVSGPGSFPQFQPNQHDHITVSGDRLAAQEVRGLIEQMAQDLQRRTTLTQLPINRGQHQFILEDKEKSLHDLLAETGCTVVLPPDHDDTEMVTIIGPHENIDAGVEKVLNLATSMQMSNVDIARHHTNAPVGAQAHARALTRYLQQRLAIEELEKQHDARIVVPTAHNAPVNWELYSRDGKNTIRARSDIMNLVNAHPPARLRHMSVDPFFYEHIEQQASKQILDDLGVFIMFPPQAEPEPRVVLVYEGAPPVAGTQYQPSRTAPSHIEAQRSAEALQEAEQIILAMLEGHQELDSRKISVPTKYEEKVRKFVEKEQQKCAPSSVPVQLVSSRDHMSRSAMPAPALSIEDLLLRGPRDIVENMAEKIATFVEDEKRDDLERGHVITVDFPQKHANHLIGRKGENINKYRDEFDVDIQVRDGKVDIKGPKAKGELAEARIVALGKKLDDEATHVLKIKPQYHRDMIGSKGNQVKRLQDRYEVRVLFPRSAVLHNDDKSLTDAASDYGFAKGGKPSQAPDEVIIKGPRKGADSARDELLSLLQWTMDNSHTGTAAVSQSQLPSLIGQGGREMEKIRITTGAQIDIPSRDEHNDPSERVQIQLRGSKKQVEDAKRFFEQRAAIFDETVSETIEVGKEYHKALIGAGGKYSGIFLLIPAQDVLGSNIRRIVVEAGGPESSREVNRTVKFPRVDSQDTTVRVEGNNAVVERILTAIRSFLSQKENQSTEIVEVAPEKHRLLIGRGGEIRRALESEFQVAVEIPKMSQQGPTRSQLRITGQTGDIARAKERILSMVKEQERETVSVPRSLHNYISANGQFFRRLRNDYKVSVDHAGHQPPAKASPGLPSGGAPSLPLITDDMESEEHGWHVVDEEPETHDEGDIPWVLRGSPEGINKARVALEKALADAKRNQGGTRTGYLTLPDPRTHRFIIGPKGSQIHSIRRETGCQIDVPNSQTKGDPIKIQGAREGVERARDIILDLVENAETGHA